ncbi:hypothetical protein [Urbifossiella limnaea]|uniref:Uncharacterized protein n=1 Tax=Urbifossiella limnaea TaxID=2528023 RepID=A0A517Y114_9BACT|nr:hypothetical protein [Urbifossiella limnaea]QDU23440.1 hypothetical protein ETAA1_54400 [Urbifossiella limnaea]
MSIDKDQLKKHHFWILLGVVPVVVLIAAFVVSATVGAAIEAKTKAVADAEKEIAGKTGVKSDPLIKLLDDQRGKLEEKKVDLWKENWERQIGVVRTKDAAGKEVLTQDQDRNLLRWPKAQLLEKYAYTPDYATDKNQLKFGDKFASATGDELNVFKVREVYLAEFSNARPGFPGTGMADKVAPTEFLGGWQSVLRHIYFPPVGAGGDNGWGVRVPTSEQIWLAMEDVWVQRAVLGQVKAVNDAVGTFTRVPLLDANNKATDSPTHRAFQSRNWRVELKVIPDEKDRRPVLVGRIKNVTDRLQPLGLGAKLTLNVWLTGDKQARPFPFHVGGEFLRGGEEREIVRTEEHNIPDGLIPGGLDQAVITRVEQVFDTRTVPVRRIDAVALGYKDSRHALMPLKMPEFESYKKEAEKADAGSAGASGPPDGMRGPSSSSSGTTPLQPGAGMIPGGTGGGAGGPVEAVVDGNRKRYVEVTAQVRRMPVAITVVVDQAYVQDVLIAYANSPLRFQTTQVHWKRFTGTLSGGGAEGGGGYGGEGGVATTGPGTSGIGFGGPPGEDGGPGASMGRPGFGRGGPGSASGPPGMPGPGVMPMPGPGVMPGPGSPGGTLTSISESQLTAGLVELTIYGIVSLYEKYQVPTDPNAPATPTAATTPTPEPTPAPKTEPTPAPKP